MASCRGRTETFARHLTCRLKTLGTEIHEGTLPENASYLEKLDNGAWLTSNNFQNDKQSSPTVNDMQPISQDLDLSTSYLKFNCTVLENVVSCPKVQEDEEEEESETKDRHVVEHESDCSQCMPLTTTQNSLPALDIINGLYISNSTTKLQTTSSSLLPSNNIINTSQMPYDTESTKVLQILGQNGTINKKEQTEQQQYNTLQNGYRKAMQMAEMKKIEKRIVNQGTIKGPIITIEAETILTTKTGTIIKNDNQYSDDNEEDERPQRVRRCSSLKTGKTPPGTPSCKKIVRFADALGLDLADIKTYLDDIPTIPLSAYEDLQVLETESITYPSPNVSNKLLMPLFQQPISLPNFIDMIKEKFVILENALITDSTNNTISGCVRVRNLDFHKSVHIRYSLDGWRSYSDLKADYMDNSCDGFSDKFLFTLYGNSLQNGQRLEFAIRFQCKGQQYWDNNYGTNYCFQCLSRSFDNLNTAPTTTLTSTIIKRNALIKESYSDLSNTTNLNVDETWSNTFY